MEVYGTNIRLLSIDDPATTETFIIPNALSTDTECLPPLAEM